jgi:hypothetical protein
VAAIFLVNETNLLGQEPPSQHCHGNELNPPPMTAPIVAAAIFCISTTTTFHVAALPAQIY